MASKQQKVIKSLMKSLDNTNLSGVPALDEAVRACSNFNSAQEVIDNMIADCRVAGDAKKFLKNYCGINLSNSDTGAITGKDAGGSKVKTNKNIVPESGSWKNFTGNSFTKNGVTFKLTDDWQPINYSDLTKNQKKIWRGLYTWWAKNSLDLIANSYGKNFSFTSKSSATTKEINFGFFEENSGTLAVAPVASTDNFKTACSLGLKVNVTNYSDINLSNKNGNPSSGNSAFYLDRILSHELTHSVMAANINNWTYLPKFIVEGMPELTHGIDDERGDTIKKLAENAVKLKQALQLSSEYQAVADVPCAEYAGGYMFLRYLAKQAASFGKVGKNIRNTKHNAIINGSSRNDSIYGENNFGVTISGGSGNDVIKGIFSSSKIDGGSGNDLISLSGGSSGNILRGGSGNDKIYGSAGDDKIYGDSGNDLLFGGAGNDTLTGGKGRDIFLCANGMGDDIITDYQSATDEIHIDSGVVNGAAYVGDTGDVEFYFESGKFTVKKAKGKNIYIKNADGGSVIWQCQKAGQQISSQIVQNVNEKISETFGFKDGIEFINTENALNPIVQNNSTASVDKIETQNFDTLTQKDTTITFTAK